MKKNKSKSKQASASKKLRKELELKLTLAFNEIVDQFGKAKKAEKVIEKFAKQLAKKVNLTVASDAIEPFIKKEEISLSTEEITTPVTEKKSPAKAKKAAKAN